jgi:hypothetical protein
MNPLMIASTALSVFGQIAAGKAQQEASELNAFGIETETELGKAQAKQMANARKEEYDSATSSNLALFAAAGRDIGSDRSVKAFLEKQKEIVGTDIGRMQTQAQLEMLQGRQRAAAERTSGKAARTASLFAAAETAASGIYKYHLAK